MAPKGRAEGAWCVFPWKTRKGGRAGRDEQKNSKQIGKNEMLMEARNIYERHKREAYYICFIFFGIF